MEFYFLLDVGWTVFKINIWASHQNVTFNKHNNLHKRSPNKTYNFYWIWKKIWILSNWYGNEQGANCNNGPFFLNFRRGSFDFNKFW
jgi:hypothetical protein